MEQERGGDAGEAALEDAQEEPAVAVGSQELPGIGPSVIKTASLTLEVEHEGFKEAFQEATGVVTVHGGFVVSSETQGERARRGSLVLRVPEDRFEAAMRDLRDLGTVRSERIGTEDVGQEFVDLEARLRNLRAQEAVLLRLMDRGGDDPGLDPGPERADHDPARRRTDRGTAAVPAGPDVVRHDLPPGGRGGRGAVRAGTDRRGVGTGRRRRVGPGGGAITAMGVAVPLGLVALLAWLVIRRARRVRRAPAA